MRSKIAEEIKLRYRPVAVIFADKKPGGAVQFQKGKWGCVIAMMTAAAKGATAVFDKETAGCTGGSVGLGFNDYTGFPGGIEYFLSTGREGFREGEYYKKDPETAGAFIKSLPKMPKTPEYVIFKPINEAEPEKENIVLVVFYANPDQLSALTVLANYDSKTNDRVVVQFSAGCHSVCLLPYMRAKNGDPRAFIGILDVSARPMVDPDILSFTVPMDMYYNMEKHSEGSFLHHRAWKKVRERIK